MGLPDRIGETEPRSLTKTTLLDSLLRLTRQSAPGYYRAPETVESLRQSLLSLGSMARLTAALTEVVGGPPKATPREFAAHLGRLAIQFWRPDFTPEQAKIQYSDFIRLLDGLTADEIRQACDDWMMDPLNRFFPTPGQLKEMVADNLRRRARDRRNAEYLLGVLRSGSPEPEIGSRDASAMLRALGNKLRGVK